ncbi:MAG: glycosyl transferase [Clostridia bacterium]|nr:glycosyl transferase [Clostridia bacterium]
MPGIFKKALLKGYYSGGYKFLSFLPDKTVIRFLYRLFSGEKPDVEDPTSFNEKLQWLKLNDRSPQYTVMVDKKLAKDYTAGIIGKEYIIPTLFCFDKAEEINFEKLPEQFVLKCNHNSGTGMYICKAKSKLSEKEKKCIVAMLKKGLSENYYAINREWPYKNVKRCIIAEKYLETVDDDLPDYKFHCFGGKVKLILVCKNRFGKSGMTEDFFDENWTHLPVKRLSHPNSGTDIPRPEQLEDMIGLAETLSKDIPFIRVDFFISEGRVYFGELTFFPASGFEKFIPEEWDKKLGDFLELPKKQ